VGNWDANLVTAGRVGHADHSAVQPNIFIIVLQLTALLFISRQAVRSCLGSFFAKRVHISRAPKIDAHWSDVFGNLDENGCVSDLMFFGIFCLEFHSLFRAPKNANKIFSSCIVQLRTPSDFSEFLSYRLNRWLGPSTGPARLLVERGQPGLSEPSGWPVRGPRPSLACWPLHPRPLRGTIGQ